MIIYNDVIYFKDSETCSPDTKVEKFAPGFKEKLLALRLILGLPMPLSSACRSIPYNEDVGGHANSFHIYDTTKWNTGGACAVDISTEDPIYRRKLIKTALDLGWSVGIAKTFVHLDRRSDYTDLPQIIFLYG